MKELNQQWADFIKANPEMSATRMAQVLGIHYSTVYRYKRELLGRVPTPRKSRDQPLHKRSFSGCIPLPKCLNHLENKLK